MMRALAFDFRDDPNALEISDEYMFGKAILVAPVVQPHAEGRTVYLPGHAPWYNFWTGEQLAGGRVIEAKADIATLPLFVRAGAILPLGPVKPYADAPSAQALELRIYPGADGSYALYDDAGDGYEYLRGQYATVLFTWDDKAHRLQIGDRKGAYKGMPDRQMLSIRCGTGSGPARDVRYDGHAATVMLEGCLAS